MRTMILIGMLLVAPALAAGDTVYQWTDKDGNVHYSGQPPPAGTQAVEKNLEPMPNVGTVDPYLDADELKQATAEQVTRENDELARKQYLGTVVADHRLVLQTGRYAQVLI